MVVNHTPMYTTLLKFGRSIISLFQFDFVPNFICGFFFHNLVANKTTFSTSL